VRRHRSLPLQGCARQRCSPARWITLVAFTLLAAVCGLRRGV